MVWEKEKKQNLQFLSIRQSEILNKPKKEANKIKFLVQKKMTKE